MTCAHKPIALSFDILRLAEAEGGEVKEFALEGNAFCMECRAEFRVYRVRLEFEPLPALANLSKCEHLNFLANLQVDRLRKTVNSKPRHVVTGQVSCYDCGRRFKPVMFRLETVEEETPLVIPSDAEIEEIGKSAQ